MRSLCGSLCCLLIGATGIGMADEKAAPRPTPLTRPEMKQYLEDMKERQPRIPLPPLSAEENARLGERENNYENRVKSLYLSSGDGSRGGGGLGREAEPNMSLDYRFKTELFWIVSRANNCQYCLGHQESKLLGAGMKEDEIAALDGDWSEFKPAERAAFSFARKFTYEPHRFTDADIVALRPYFKDLQILEMVLSMAGNNQINRWKEGIGVPQSRNGGGFGRRGGASQDAKAQPVPAHQSYVTPTSDTYKSKITKVAAVQVHEKTGEPTRTTRCLRQPLETPAEVERALTAARSRSPRLPLVDEAKARALLPKDWPEGRPTQWVRLLANFPGQGMSRIMTQRNADEKGDLTPLLKAQVSWIIARQDRAWYAVDEAKRRLRGLGWSDEQIYQLDGDWTEFKLLERALFTLARKLAASPVVLTDDDVAMALKLAGPRDVVQLVQYTTIRAAFDRITEVAGLQIE